MSSKKSKAAADNDRLFHSFDGSNIRVPHADGTVAVVGETPRTLPRKLWRTAVRLGCQTGAISPDQLKGAGLSAEDDAFERREKIREVMRAMIEADETDKKYLEAYTGDDRPQVRFLEKEVGFPIEAGERDELWREVSGEYEEQSEEEQEEQDA